MGLFTAGTGIEPTNEAFSEDILDEMVESSLLMYYSQEDDTIRESFIGEASKVLVEAGKMRKKTLVRLGANDDLSRRETLAAMILAKKAGDPLWDKLAANRVKEKALLGAIRKKYASKSTRLAKAGQKDYIKNRMPKGFNVFPGNVR